MKPKAGQAWITRRRWDGYFLVGAIAAVPIGVASWLSGAGLRALGPALMMLMSWAVIRWTWPREGGVARTLTGAPGLIPLIWWMGLWGLGGGVGGLIVLDRFVPIPEAGQPPPLATVQVWVGFALAWVVVFVSVVHQIECRSEKPGGSHSPPLE